MQRTLRMKKELHMFSVSPPHGISCWANDENITNLSAQILGGEGTPYSGGLFKLDIQIPDRYPFEPPKVKFVTPIYHPNIDNGGRICLDTLKMPPKGAWKPCLNISTVLTSIQLLMAEPNPEDPLMTDISNEYKYNKAIYIQNARDWTKKHAMQHSIKDKPKESEGIAEKENVSRIQPSKQSSQNINTGVKRPSQPMVDLINKKLKE